MITVDVPGLGWVDATIAGRRLGELMHVLTAWNPGVSRPTHGANDAANAELRQALAERGLDVLDALGSSPDGTHQEESFAVVGLSRDAAVELGSRFGQDAVFELSANAQTVVGCDGGWSLTRPLV